MKAQEGHSVGGYHMSAEEFRTYGHAVIDWIADYQQRVETFPVLSRLKPGQIRASLPDRAPVKGDPMDDILRDIDARILPGITHWQSPNFFAYFPSNTSGPSILGELLTAGLGVQGMLWQTSPACTELETHVLDWLVDMLGLPESFSSKGGGGGVIQDTASSAVLCAIVAARGRALARHHLSGDSTGKLATYASTQAHSSVEKGLSIAGTGGDMFRLIDVDEHFAMRPALLRERMMKDREEGFIPCFVCATVGTTSSLAMDPLIEIGEICRKEGAWFHVDAAMAGSAAVCPEFRAMHSGLDTADSYCFNPHKWLFTNMDCDCFYVADRSALVAALSVMPEYLRNTPTESGTVIDYRDWQIPLGRRFRALKLWFVIRHYGVAGLQYHIRRHVELARMFAAWVSESDDFELAVAPVLNLVCFRHKRGDAVNRRLLDRLNGSGKMFITHAMLGGKFTLRMCIGQTHTEEKHVRNAWDLIRAMSRDFS